MKKTALISSIAICMMILAALPAWSERYHLAEKDFKKLSPESKEIYLKGISHLDHLNRESALECFQIVKNMEPNHHGIRFVVGELSYRSGRKESGNDLDTLLLSPLARTKLTPEARIPYEKGVKSLDAVNPAGALEFFKEAAKTEEQNADLRHLVSNLTNSISGKRKADLALILLLRADAAYKELLAMKDLNRKERMQASDQVKAIDHRINGMALREGRREEIARLVFEEKRIQQKELVEQIAKAAETRAKQAKARAASMARGEGGGRGNQNGGQQGGQQGGRGQGGTGMQQRRPDGGGQGGPGGRGQGGGGRGQGGGGGRGRGNGGGGGGNGGGGGGRR